MLGLLKVGTFNGYQSNLPKEAGAVLARWGRELISRADIVFLQEFRNSDHIRTVAAAAELDYTWIPHPEEYSDVAILSRYPLTSMTSHSVPRATIVDATANIDGVEHRLLGSHFTTGQVPPWESVPDRVTSAQKVVELARADNRPTFFGGDLNTCPYPREAGECLSADGTAPEYRAIAEWFYDAFRLSDADSPQGNRIDQIHVRGPYDVAEYRRFIGADVEPSDHPFVLVTFERSDAGDLARAYSVDGPVSVEPGETFDARILMTNSGQSTWTRRDGYGLATWRPALFNVWGNNFVELRFDEVGPGVTVGFNLRLTAPSSEGTYPFQWRMARNGGEKPVFFGERTPAAPIEVRTSPGVTTVPDVVESYEGAAATAITESGLVPSFAGAVGKLNAYVAAQSPSAGAIASVGSTVRCFLKIGPIP